MDDLNEKLTRLLSSPDGMAKVRSAMAALGTAPPSDAAPPPALPVSPPALPVEGLMPLIGKLGQESDGTRLLRALRPYLHGEREKRLDEAIRLLRLVELMPLLQESGLLKGE